MITAEGVTRLFQKEIWPHEGIPEQIITDRGPQFVATFMKELYRLLKITKALSTVYHPQTDGQMEQVNQKVEVYLCTFINHHQDDWEDYLQWYFCGTRNQGKLLGPHSRQQNGTN